ncbi:MAG: hypothetical protein M3Q97_11425 [Bacteroidota bacterium]|nr:hypothetical protein [Bacteroidota bacterium]
MKNLLFAVLLSALIMGCNDESEKNSDNANDQQDAFGLNDTNGGPHVQPEPPPPPRDPNPLDDMTDTDAARMARGKWHPLMTQYHDLQCRKHRGESTPQLENQLQVLAKGLEQMGSTLTPEEKGYFTTDMQRASSVINCQ